MDLFSLSIPIKVSGKQQVTAELQAIGRVGQQVAKDLNLSFAQTKTGLLVPAGAIEATTRRTREFSNAARAASVDSMRYARAAFTISGVMQAVAATGRTSNEQIKMLIGTASGVAFAFGPTGAIVGAIGLSILAIKEMFDRTREGMDETKKKAIETVRDIFSETSAEGAQSRKAALERQVFDLEHGDLALARQRREELLAPHRRQRPGSTDEQLAGLILNQQRLVGGEFTDLTKQIGELEKALATLRTQASAAGLALEAMESRERERIADARSRIGTIGSLSGFIAPGRDLVGEAAAARFRNRAPVLLPGQFETDIPGLGKGFGGRGSVGAAAGMVASPADLKQNIIDGLAGPTLEALAETQALVSAAIDTHIVGGIGNALAEGFARAFSGEGFGGLLQGFTGSILSSLGSMFIELGKHFIAFGTIMETIRESLTSFFGAGVGSIVGGLALVALGAAMTGGASAIMSGGRSRGVGSAGSVGGSQGLTDSLARYSFNPSTMNVADLNRSGFTVHNWTLVGAGDPAIQRGIKEIVRKADRRNL